jgi:hypothetical protein
MNIFNRKKILLPLILLVIAIIAVVAVIFVNISRGSSFPNDENPGTSPPNTTMQSDEDEGESDNLDGFSSSLSDSQITKGMEIYVQVLNTNFELQTILGKDAVLPMLYQRVAERRVQEISTDTACEEASASIIEDEALYWYAGNMGFDATDEEVVTMIDQIIVDSKKADNFALIEKACNNTGVSFDNTVRASYLTYQRSIATGKYYSYLMEQYMRQNNLDEKPTLRQDEAWTAYWDDITANAIAAYKETEKYVQLEQSLSAEAARIKENDDIIANIKNSDLSAVNRFPE